jgi:hypothetical protein
VYTSLYASKFLTILGIIVRKNIDFTKKINEYKYISNLSQEKKESIVLWSPFIKMKINIMGHQDLNDLSWSALMSDFGILNEFFYCNNEVIKDIVEMACNQLVNNNSLELIKFKQRIEHHFPFDKNSYLPLPAETGNNPIKIELFTTDENGNEIKKTTVNPGETLSNIKLKFSDGQPVLSNIKSVSAGFHFMRLQKNVFTLIVDNLSKFDEDNNLIPVTAEEYQHTQDFVPKKDCYVIVESEKYRVSVACTIPKRMYKGGRTGFNTLSLDNNDGSYTTKGYIHCHPKVFGQYIVASDTLHINVNNPLIYKIISKDKNQYPWLLKDWTDLYLKLAKLAREVTHTCLSEINVTLLTENSEKYEQLHEIYEDAKNYYLNKHLELFFTYSSDAQQLLKKIDLYDKNDDAAIMNGQYEEVESMQEKIAI